MARPDIATIVNAEVAPASGTVVGVALATLTERAAIVAMTAIFRIRFIEFLKRLREEKQPLCLMTTISSLDFKMLIYKYISEFFNKGLIGRDSRFERKSDADEFCQKKKRR